MTRRALLAAAAAGVATAQRKNRAPVSKENLVVKLQEAPPIKLSNGVTLLVLEDNRLPLAFARFQVEGAGSIYSPQPGVAELTADMLDEGAGGRSAKQIAAEAARLGATVLSGSASGAEVATVDGSGLSGRFEQWLALMADVLLRPAFSADEFHILRQRRAVGAKLRMGPAGTVAEDTMQRLVYGEHPAAAAVPAPEALAALSPETLSRWHRERYAPASTVVSCIGKVNVSSLASRLETLLSGWKTAALHFELPPPPRPAATRRVVLVDRPGAAQTEIAIGGLLFERRDPDFYPMTVLNHAFGVGTSSRLSRLLRDEKGYAYSAQSTFVSTRFPGYWRLRAGVRTDSTADSLSLMLDQLRRLREEPMPAEELGESQRAVIGRFALNFEQPQQVLGLSYLRNRYGFSADYWERYPAKLASVSASEIQAVAQKYLDPGHAHIVAVGDAAKIRSALAKHGAVESS